MNSHLHNAPPDLKPGIKALSKLAWLALTLLIATRAFAQFASRGETTVVATAKVSAAEMDAAPRSGSLARNDFNGARTQISWGSSNNSLWRNAT